MPRLIGIALLLFATSLHAQTNSILQIAPKQLNDPKLTDIYNEDQRVRKPRPLAAEGPKITRTDVDRLAIVKQMIADDQLQTTADYHHAAIIVQHSLVSSDYLVAHTLALICAADGDKTCLWLSAATLDRYLQSIQQPQIYGTQFKWAADLPMTQQPYSSDLITDALREKLGVPSFTDQQKQLDDLKAHPLTLPALPAPAPRSQPVSPN